MSVFGKLSGFEPKTIAIGIGATILVLAVGYGAYQFDRQIEKRVESEKENVQLETNYGNLRTAVDEITKQLGRLNAENEKLEKDVALSDKNVKAIRAQLANERARQRATPVPEASDEQIRWLREQVEALKEGYAR